MNIACCPDSTTHGPKGNESSPVPKGTPATSNDCISLTDKSNRMHGVCRIKVVFHRVGRAHPFCRSAPLFPGAYFRSLRELDLPFRSDIMLQVFAPELVFPCGFHKP